MWIKICGLSDEEALEAAAEAGADAIGLVFCPSRRRVSPQRAAALARLAPPGLAVIGVFQNQSQREIAAVLAEVPLSGLQFAGSEPPDLVAAFSGLFRLKTVALAPGEPFPQGLPHEVDAWLLDRRVGPRSGGLGIEADWDVARQAARSRRLVLAGGLRPETVARAISTVHPWGVDVSSGVETEGGKDPQKIRAFVRQAKEAERRAS